MHLNFTPQAITLVPLYDTLGEEGVKFILNQTEMTILVVHPKTVAAYLKYLPEVRYNCVSWELTFSAHFHIC